jgi:hypothetical protein
VTITSTPGRIAQKLFVFLCLQFFNVLFVIAGEWFSLLLNAPLIAYHVQRYMKRPVMSGPGTDRGPMFYYFNSIFAEKIGEKNGVCDSKALLNSAKSGS